jgi:hypothetical protein
MITVPAGQNLQAVLDAAPAGETVQLEPGATFTGNFARRDPITLVGPATLRTVNSAPALRTLPGASGWRLRDVTFVAGASQGDILQLGDLAITDLAAVPRDIELERCVIRAETSAKRGVQLNSADTRVRHCRVEGVKLAGTESQAICGWTGPGPFLIEDCYIEAGSIGILVGGAPPSIPNLTPTGIVIRRCTITRPLAYRGAGYGVKNLLELKHAADVLIEGNVLEHNWPDAQSGWSIVLTVRANGPNAPWTTIRDVTLRGNRLRRAALGVNILGLDNQEDRVRGGVYPSQRMQRVTFTHNIFEDVGGEWGAAGHAFLVSGAPEDVTIHRNTILQRGSILSVNGDACPRFTFTDNLTRHNSYGIFGDRVGVGNRAITFYFPGSTITGNVIAASPTTGGTAANYPAGNTFVSGPTAQDTGNATLDSAFVDPAAGDYRQLLWPAVGCDCDILDQAQREPAPPPPPPVPTVHEVIDRVAADFEVDCLLIGGSVSPQAAAERTRVAMRDALKASLPDRPVE